MLKIRKILFICFLQILIADDTDSNNIYYLLPGPNLVSFNTLPDNTTISNIFNDIQEDVISIISEGQISHNIDNSWVGTLEDINNEKGYWIITSNVTLLDLNGNLMNPPLYFLNEGSNLISYPYNSSQSLINTLPFYMQENLIAIIGENEAALFYNNQIYGSLTDFEPNKGYWFLLSSSVPFEYDEPLQNQNIDNSMLNDDDNIYSYNQSSSQSVFFIEQAYINGTMFDSEYDIILECNNILVGGKSWNGYMTDIIAMGNDGYELTGNYCTDNQHVSIKTENNSLETEMYIIGDDLWGNNKISLISISNLPLGDINLDTFINITDIIIAIEHIIDINIIINDHQLLLFDINTDDQLNVTDIIFIIDSIID